MRPLPLLCTQIRLRTQLKKNNNEELCSPIDRSLKSMMCVGIHFWFPPMPLDKLFTPFLTGPSSGARLPELEVEAGSKRMLSSIISECIHEGPLEVDKP